MTDRSQTPAFRAAELAATLALHCPNTPVYRLARMVTDLQAIAKTAKRHAERMCSDAAYVERWSDPETGEDKRRKRFTEAVSAALKNLDTDSRKLVSVTHSGDPRGAVVHMHIKGLSGDGWGNGFAIY